MKEPVFDDCPQRLLPLSAHFCVSAFGKTSVSVFQMQVPRGLRLRKRFPRRKIPVLGKLLQLLRASYYWRSAR